MPLSATAHQGDTLDALCWRVLGTTAGGVVEAALDLNRNLADAGAVLAEGQGVILPDLVPATILTRETVNLWD